MKCTSELAASYAGYLKRVQEATEPAALAGRSLQFVCRRARGAFPTDVVAALSQISFDYYVERLPASVYNDPEPHPLDFDWRFSARTAAYIASKACRESPVLCLGVPTVFRSLLSAGVPALLIDRNPHAAKGINKSGSHIVTKDVEDIDRSDVQGLYDMAVMDPPWYPDDYELWLARLLRLLRPRATFFTTIFPDLLRPSAHVEQVELCRSLRQLGGVRRLPRFAVYSTPPFEAEVLAGAGLGSVPKWRIAPLLEVTLTDGAHDRGPPEKERKRSAGWNRYVVGHQTVAVAIMPASGSHFSYASVGDSFALDSVSRRDPRRARINVWTSRNCVAEVSETRTLDRFLSRLASGSPVELASQQAASDFREANLLVSLLSDLHLLNEIGK